MTAPAPDDAVVQQGAVRQPGEGVAQREGVCDLDLPAEEERRDPAQAATVMATASAAPIRSCRTSSKPAIRPMPTMRVATTAQLGRVDATERCVVSAIEDVAPRRQEQDACAVLGSSSTGRVPSSPRRGTPSLFRVQRIAPSRGESRRVPLRLLALLAWAVLAVVCVVVFGWSLDALVGAAGCAVLVAVTVTDIERRIIPNRIVLPATAVALVVQTLRDPGVGGSSSLAAGGFFLVLALVYPAGLGMGDVKLAAFLGAWLGWDVLVALLVGSLLGAAMAMITLGRHGERAEDDPPVRAGARRRRRRRTVHRRGPDRRLARLIGAQPSADAPSAGERLRAARRPRSAACRRGGRS